jgi:hypothetical protein
MRPKQQPSYVQPFTDTQLGLPQEQQPGALGNGVLPVQATAALDALCPRDHASIAEINSLTAASQHTLHTAGPGLSTEQDAGSFTISYEM